ncbi:MAG: prepilin-type N-terminal cleavage/methylation domain-containing protein [Bacilli bacterium]|nr:prepilin-type N-terminal cleavage/methylation domain-containing protein [Bacilli bacterium]
MKKTGFTLIELLAVIVILAIIALIATPMILGVINTAKKGSAESSTLGYVDSVEKSTVIALLNDEASGSTTALAAGTYYVDATGDLASDVALTEKVLDVNYKGEAPEAGGTITIGSEGDVTAATLEFPSIYAYAVDYANNKATARNS